MKFIVQRHYLYWLFFQHKSSLFVSVPKVLLSSNWNNWDSWPLVQRASSVLSQNRESPQSLNPVKSLTSWGSPSNRRGGLRWHLKPLHNEILASLLKQFNSRSLTHVTLMTHMIATHDKWPMGQRFTCDVSNSQDVNDLLIQTLSVFTCTYSSKVTVCFLD